MTMIITDLVTKQQERNLPFYPFTTQTPNNVQFNEAVLSFREVTAARSRGVTQVNSQAQSLQSTPAGSIADNTFNPLTTAAFLTIADRIVELNQCGYLAIDSQPAVNGVKSDHDIYGWGLKSGYVYQKAYVEFFISPHQLPALIQRLGRKPHFTFVAANKSGDLQTNIPFSRTSDRCSNVITWGVFPDCEIVQKTVVDLDNFVKWKEEALEVWSQWAHGYPEASEARILLETIGEEWYLVNVVNDDYHDPEGLFTFFEEDRSAQEELRQQ
ncbi:hypothetical protein BGZ67_001685 [Mortierella alpina]|nr:hypothetical protein BGZ67_001685 [Mortierella alpina]